MFVVFHAGAFSHDAGQKTVELDEMYCRALAIDFDGTAAKNGQIAPDLMAALGKARSVGISTILVSGRILDDLRSLGTDFSAFDAVVAENGAILWFPPRGGLKQVGASPPDSLLIELRRRGIPFHCGAVVIGTSVHHVSAVIEILRQSGLDLQLVLNREALMLLPSEVNKGTAIRRALDELELSERNLIAFGDAENDHPMLQLAEIAVAAHDAVPGIAAAADVHLTVPNGAGLARYIFELLDNKATAPTPPRQDLLIGYDAEKAPVRIAASGINMLISGDPRSGKSWLTGLLVELLLDGGYRLCLIDPEGNYANVEDRPHVLRFGGEIPLPAPAAVPRLFRSGLSLIFALNEMPEREQLAYVDELLLQLESSRTTTGLPHWIMVDEAHYFFHNGSPCCARTSAKTGNFLLVAYHPSLIASDVHATIGAHLLMPTTVEDERYFLTTVLQEKGPRGLDIAEALSSLRSPLVGLLLDALGGARWQVLTPIGRVTNHVHHERKYADVPLPEHHAFHFRNTGGAPFVARNVSELHAAVQSVPLQSLRHHLVSGDLSRWASDVLGNEPFAHALRHVERAVAIGAAPNRTELSSLIEGYYAVRKQERR